MTNTSAAAILDRLAILRIRVEAHGEKLWLIPAGKVPPDLDEAIRAHKPEIIAALGSKTEPAPALPIGGLPMPGDCQACPLRYDILGRWKCLWAGWPRKLAIHGGKCPLSNEERDQTFDWPFVSAKGEPPKTRTPAKPEAEPWPEETAHVLSWLESYSLPRQFVLHCNGQQPVVTISDGPRFKQDVLRNAQSGPGQGRDQYGAVRRDLARVRELFGARAEGEA